LSNSPIDLLLQPKSSEERDVEADQSSNSQVENVNENETTETETNQCLDNPNEVLDMFSLREYEEGEEEGYDSQEIIYDVVQKSENLESDKPIDNNIDFTHNDLNDLLDSPNSQHDSDGTQDKLKRKLSSSFENSSISENSINEDEENQIKTKNKTKKVHKSKQETLVA
jgi:hypothetical protein